jgi:hypothetical protein
MLLFQIKVIPALKYNQKILHPKEFLEVEGKRC